MVKKLYLLSFDAHKSDTRAVHDAVKYSKNINGWSHYLASSYFIFSSASAKQISKELQNTLPKFRHIINEVNPAHYHGLMPTKQWEWLKRNIK